MRTTPTPAMPTGHAGLDAAMATWHGDDWYVVPQITSVLHAYSRGALVEFEIRADIVLDPSPLDSASGRRRLLDVAATVATSLETIDGLSLRRIDIDVSGRVLHARGRRVRPALFYEARVTADLEPT